MTWITIALAAGVPLEIVQRVTGHATVDVVLRHYFRSGRDAFKAALMGALPSVLTGGVDAAVKTLESAGLAMSQPNRRLTNHDFRISKVGIRYGLFSTFCGWVFYGSAVSPKENEVYDRFHNG